MCTETAYIAPGVYVRLAWTPETGVEPQVTGANPNRRGDYTRGITESLAAMLAEAGDPVTAFKYLAL